MPWGTRLAVLIASALVLCNAETTPTPGRNGHYMVVAPAEIQAGADFVVSVTILDASLTTSPLTASLQYMKDPPIASVTQSIAAGATTQLTLQVPMNVTQTKYNLFVDAATPRINHNKSLNVKSKSLSLLIQTDKPIYKAGELIQYRAIALYPDLKPYHGQVNVSIQDAKGNRIAQWLNMTTSHGVVNGSLRLSSEPLLGDWTVTAEIDGLYVQTASKTVEVDKYVLPKFEVALDVPPFFVAVANDDLAHLRTAVTLRLSAKYTYGKCVEGTALLKIQVHPFSSADANQYRILSNTAQIRCNGNDIFEWVISYREILSLAPPPRHKNENYHPALALQGRELLVVGEMTEGVSDVVLATNATINVTPHKYTVEIMTITPSTYKRGLDYTAFLRVTTQAGSPPDSRDVVFPNGSRAQCLFSMGNNNPSALVNITDSGIMAISLNVSSITSIWSVRVDCFNNLISDYSSVKRFLSDSSDAIQLSLDSDNATVVADQRVDFRLTSTQPYASFTYQVLSKGSVILAKTESGQRNTVHTFSFYVSAELAQMLAPSARVLVWTKTSTNEILADSLDLVVIGAFNHQVSLSFSESILAPGDTNQLTVRAHPGSFVGLLAVDQSVIIHAGNGNDISRDDVLDDMTEYDSSESSGGDQGPMPMMRCGCGFWWPISVGGVDSSSIFKNAGVTVFTDSLIYKSHKFPVFNLGPEWDVEDDAMIPEFDGGVGAALPDQNEELQPVARTRKNFPETWLWTDTSIGSDGEVTLEYTVPDTITSWVASAFAMNSQVGLGISDTAQMTVFKPFFVSLNLPYSVIRGEELVLQANVFNYMTTEQQVFVTLESSSDFAIRKSPNDVVAVHDSQQLSTMVGANRAGQVLFVVKPVTLGTIMLNVRAQSAEAGDAVERTLVVEPEGAPGSYSSSLLFNHEDNASRCENVIIRLPGDLVPGSARIKVTATGDVMGGTMNGLENLVRMPYGCGEQNMLNFAPNIYVMDYLRVTGQDDADITSKAMTYMQQGYQRELNYQHKDGSFSAFGESDNSGSTWLTAFVVRCFHQARHYVPLDSSLLIKALRWLTAQMDRDGSFQEPGRVIHTTMQGGGGDGVGMTAYTLLALLENRQMMDLEDQISRTVTYLEQLVKLDRVTDQKYEMAIITYALTLAGSSEATQALTILNELATERDNLKFWEPAVEEEEETADRYYYHHAPTTNIEATAYALLTFTHNAMLVDAMKIAEWMMLQRNAQGGFSSTQDTVIGLQALAAFAAATRQSSQSMTVSVLTDSTRQIFTPITAENSLLYRSMEVANTADNVTICASGTGLAVVQVNVNYHVFTPSVKPDVDVRVTSRSKGKSVTVHVCNSWQGESSSGMVVTEVNQLSGYAVSNVDALLNDVDELSRVDVMGKQIVMYFDEVIEQTRCFDIEMTQIEPVANIQKATVKTYPYYGPEKGQIKYYRPEALVDLNMCDVCDICDCGDYIPTPRPTEPGVPYPNTGTLATGTVAGWMGVMIAALLALL